MARSAPLRYLSAGDVQAAMPPLEERLDLAEQVLIALATPGATDLPPKIAVHPRPESSFAHAMPALLRGSSSGDDLLGIKWVTGYATNRALGVPAIHALVVLNDAATGAPTAILDGGAITAERTAAVSGVAIRRFAPRPLGRPLRAAIVGAGVQGRSHLAVLAGVVPGVLLTVFDRHPDRTGALLEIAVGMSGIAQATAAGSAREAVEGADVVVTAASMGPVRQVMTNDWLADEALVVPIDYATYCAAEVAREAALFLVDERGQFLANRDAGLFDDYPDPTATIGEAILGGTTRPAGRVLVSHLGVGLADVVFGSAIVARAEELGLGSVLAT